MKTDYGRLGRESLERLEGAAKYAAGVQNGFLLAWVHENRHTEFGKRHGFSDINSIQKYRERVPLSTYGDYARDIERIIGGEKNILTAGEAVYFCISSGTVGGEKYVPLTRSDLEMHYIYMYGAVFGQIREYYGDRKERDIFGKIFQIGEFAKTHMPDGRMSGIRSSCVYQWLNEGVGFDTSDYCVPGEVLFPDTLEDRLYTKVRFALAERSLTAIHGVFINRVAGVVEYILQNAKLLLHDMEFGTVSPSVPLNGRWRKYLCEMLPPNPRRADELWKIFQERDHRGIVKKIWKNMKYILAIGGESFSYYTEKMREYAGDIPIHYFVYAASEGVFGLAENVNVADRYMLLPESVFFEFIPMDREGPPLLMDELQIGGKYELVITNRSGLYRYRIGDVVEVVGWHKKAPVVKFCFRQNQVLNIAGEKSNQQQLDAAVKLFSRHTGAGVKGYSVGADVSGISPGYLLYMECDGIPENADTIFEECFCTVNPEYKACRKMREIKPLHIEFLREGSFKSYERELAQKGKPMAQNKMPRFLDTEEKRQFFARHTLNRGQEDS